MQPSGTNWDIIVEGKGIDAKGWLYGGRAQDSCHACPLRRGTIARTYESDSMEQDAVAWLCGVLRIAT